MKVGRILLSEFEIHFCFYARFDGAVVGLSSGQDGQGVQWTR